MRNSLFSLTFLVSACVAVLVGCGKAPELVGVENPNIPVEAVPDLKRHQIFIMSTREATEVVGALYSGERSPELGLASVDVTVPPNHVPGELERPKRLPPDPRKEFTVIDPVIYSTENAFVAQINSELAKRPPGERKLLLFIHGYNNSTSDAILRLSQFVEDTGYQGVPVLFTWASANKLPRYVYDLNSALIARVKIKDMSSILLRTSARDVDVFAHSMGTFLTMEGLVDAQMAGTLGKRANIKTIMLASPDIDIDLFRTQISLLPRSITERIYLLISEDDGALKISRRLAGGVPRVGAADAAELEELGVNVIDLSQIDDSSSGSHTKFAGSPEVVQLIGEGLRTSGRFGESSTPLLGQLLANSPIRILGN